MAGGLALVHAGLGTSGPVWAQVSLGVGLGEFPFQEQFQRVYTLSMLIPMLMSIIIPTPHINMPIPMNIMIIPIPTSSQWFSWDLHTCPYPNVCPVLYADPYHNALHMCLRVGDSMGLGMVLVGV